MKTPEEYKAMLDAARLSNERVAQQRREDQKQKWSQELEAAIDSGSTRISTNFVVDADMILRELMEEKFKGFKLRFRSSTSINAPYEIIISL